MRRHIRSTATDVWGSVWHQSQVSSSIFVVQEGFPDHTPGLIIPRLLEYLHRSQGPTDRKKRHSLHIGPCRNAENNNSGIYINKPCHHLELRRYVLTSSQRHRRLNNSPHCFVAVGAIIKHCCVKYSNPGYHLLLLSLWPEPELCQRNISTSSMT